MAVHQWLNKYRVPLPQRAVISDSKPGQQIAKCITEIQAQIDAIQTQIDALANTGALPDASGVTDYKVLQAKNGKATWDWVRAHA